MAEWLLLFIAIGGSHIAATQPMTLEDCLKWQARHKPEQKAVCVRVINTELGPYVERRP